MVCDYPPLQSARPLCYVISDVVRNLSFCARTSRSGVAPICYTCIMNFEDFFTQSFATASLEGEQVVLEGLRERDSSPEALGALLASIEECKDYLAEHLPWVDRTDVADLKKRIRSWILAEQLSQGGCWKILEKNSNSLTGFIMLDVNLKNRSATVSYWLLKKYSGKGYMTEALKLLSLYTFSTLKLNRLELFASVENAKSAAVASRCGFLEEGICRDFELKKGIFIDHRRFSKLARDL